MASLSIRNISATSLTLVKVERFAAQPADDSGGVLSFIRNLLHALGLGGAAATGLVPVPDKAATAQEDVPGDGVAIAPFATVKTTVRAADVNGREVLRLTLTSGGTTYTVNVPGASPHSICLTAVDGDTKKETPLTVVYRAADAWVAVLDNRAASAAWMGAVDGAWPLSSLSLPGTHNSPAHHRALPSVRCQAVDVATQLAHGVRFLDVRVSARPGGADELSLVHSVFPIGLLGTHRFAALYADVRAFLAAHPSETVLVSVKREGTGRGSDADLARQLHTHYIAPDPSLWFVGTHIPTLADVRGKIVLIRRFGLPPGDAPGAEPFRGGFGIDAAAWPDNCADGTSGSGLLRLQDFYDVAQTTSITTKISYARALLEHAAGTTYAKAVETQTQGQPSPVPPLFVNFLTGSNFFNASCWPEKVAARVNPAVIDHLCMRHNETAVAAPNGSVPLPVGDASGATSSAAPGDGSTGVVVTDWVGYKDDWDLIRCIIAWNARLQLKQ